jgi:ferrous iron transport protein B
MRRHDAHGAGSNDTPNEPLIALVGQPNCGKSTLFNALAGFKANTGNFPGTSVAITQSRVAFAGLHARIVDLPGTYSLTPRDGAEEVTRRYLSEHHADAVIAVVDASVLSRSVELALELLETGLPIVIALNMMDEARRKGIIVDVAALEARLGVPVVPTVATRGEGVVAVALKAMAAAKSRRPGIPPVYDRDIEAALASLLEAAPPRLAETLGVPPRFLAVRLLEADPFLLARLTDDTNRPFLELAAAQRQYLADLHDWPEESVFGSHRHAAAMDLFEAVATVRSRGRRSKRERLDDVLMHPFWGLVFAALALAGLFLIAFVVGDRVAGLVQMPFEALGRALLPATATGLWADVGRGLLDGIAGGAGIVLPYLVPLLLVMSLMEDVGYLPRAAFLVDGLLHRVGLHGKSVIPLILGYGCNVPGILGTRILESPRDRVITALLVPLTACSARTVIILALVAATMGPLAALGVYVLNIVVTALAARLLSAIVPGSAPGLLMDIPPYRIPPVKAVLRKVWFRVREFLVNAWPVLIAASIFLGILTYLGVDTWVNQALRPVTVGVLGLPEAVGVTLFFGILRKELSLVMLFQALGTTDVASVLTAAQLLTFTLFVTFYVPCVSTLAAQVREVGWRWTLVGVGLNTSIALGVAVIARFAMGG